MRGVEGQGRHLRNGSATAARQHVALTHPSNLRKPVGDVTRQTSMACDALRGGPRSHWHGRLVAALAHPGLVHGLLAQQRKEDPDKPARQRYHRDLLAPPGGYPPRPHPQVRRAWIAHAPYRHRGLDQQPAHSPRPRFGDPPASLRFARYVTVTDAHARGRPPPRANVAYASSAGTGARSARTVGYTRCQKEDAVARRWPSLPR